MVHIYTGDGKGKTTAAVGLAVRAAGRGKRVLFVQFLKDNTSGEVAPMQQIGITVRGLARHYDFVYRLKAAERQVLAEEQNRLLVQICQEVQQDLWDVVVLDEIIAACQLQVADEQMVDGLIQQRRDHLELILTGRDAPARWLAQADYITEMVLCRHPYQQGVEAREGIEY